MAHRTRIKICGMTREADVDAAVEAGADALGFNFYPPSPRAITPQRAGQLARRLPPFVTPVLLFVNASPDDIAAAVQAVPNALLQFHGDETPEQCLAPGRPYLRAARMAPDMVLLDFAALHAQAAGLLLDTHVAAYGGSGKAFDWSLVPPHVPLPVVLSGGLSPASVAAGIAQLRPWGVDVSTGVEVAKGIKDAALMRAFCDAVRRADSLTRQ